MRKPLIVCGSRDAVDLHTEIQYSRIIDAVVNRGGYDQIVSGGAFGADVVGELYAENNYLGLVTFPADWDTHGKSAGPRRNDAMAKYAAGMGGGIVAFKGGMGTADMLRRAKRYGLTVEYDGNAGVVGGEL